jgi:hypothetical protein
MTNQTIFQVVFSDYMEWEYDNRDVVASATDLEIAISLAKEYLLKTIFSPVKDNDQSAYFVPNFHRFNDFSPALPELFKNKKKSRIDEHTNIFIVAQELNTLADKKSPNIVWTMDINFLFNLFSDKLDLITKRDGLDNLPLEEKVSFWNAFRKNPRILETGVSVSFWNSKGIDFGDCTLSGAELWSMTKQNQKEIEIFEKYEL